MLVDHIRHTPSYCILLLAGLCIVEWCGNVLEGATHEEVRRVLGATDHQREIELVVKKCRYVGLFIGFCVDADACIC